MRDALMIIAAVSLAWLSACDPATFFPPEGESGPRITALSTETIQVGQTLWFVGSGLPQAGEGETFLEFQGAYLWQDDSGEYTAEEVPSFTIAPVFDGTYDQGGEVLGTPIGPGQQLLRWNRFGPWYVPFGGSGDKPGIFRGTVTPITVDVEGNSSQGQALEVALEVEPSILITRLEPVIGASGDPEAGEELVPKTPNCDGPALRVFGGLPYILQVETMGFAPEYFIYELSNVNGDSQWTEFSHSARGTADRLGTPWEEQEIFVFNGLTDDVEFAISTIRVTAVDAENNTIETVYPVSIVRPVGFNYDGERRLAEYYEPVPVHGPIVGGIGTTITYAESQTESRQKGVSVSFTRSVTNSATQTDSSSWNQGYGYTESDSNTLSEDRTDTESSSSTEAYGSTYATTDETRVELSSEEGTSWGFNFTEGTNQTEMEQDMNSLYGEVSGSVTTEAGGGVSIPGVANASGKVGTTVGASAGKNNTTTTGNTVGSSTQSGNSSGGSTNNGSTFGSTTTDSQSESISGSYGVGNQTSINSGRSETQASSESTTYDMGGATSVSEGYTEGNSETWSETWVDTTSSTQLLSYSGKVPNGRCAVIYRQTVRYVRVAKLIRHDLCGVREKMADLTFNEWSWSPNIAIGDDCADSLPESTQPKAECFHACD